MYLWEISIFPFFYYPALCEDFGVRIIVEDEVTFYSGHELKPSTYYIDNELAIGRIEICLREKWKPICEDFFTQADASVVCQQLGFSRAGKIL